MQPPKSFRINGQLWRVKVAKVVELEDVDVLGVCEYEKRTITLQKQKPDEMMQTFLHEWFHAVLYEYGFYVTELHSDLEEMLAECLAQQLFRTFKLKMKK
jgi:hypothetical protein